MSLHLAELPMDLAALYRWAGAREMPGPGHDEGLVLHHLLTEVFGPKALHPFRLMVAPRARRATLYAYCALSADELRAQAALTIAPAEAAVVGLDRLRSVPRPAETWRAGMRLGFDLKARPVMRLAKPLDAGDETFRKGAEVDAFLVEALRRDAALPREEVYLDWLADRFGDAARLERAACRLARFQRSRVIRNGRPTEGPEAVIHGTLTVTDPARFGRMLALGIGRHRAYGFGMLLLRPPGRKA